MQDDFFTGAKIGPESLVFTQSIALDDVLGCIQDRLGGSVILFEHNDPGVGEIALETQYIFCARAAPGVNHLVIVTHNTNISKSLVSLISAKAKQTNQFILRQIAILELINVDIAPARLIPAKYLWLAPPELFGQHQQIVEIDAIIGA